MAQLTKKLVERCIRFYIDKGNSPSDQPEPRDSKYFDIRGITQEMYEWLKEVPQEMKEAQIESIIKKVLRLAERNANLFKCHRVTEANISAVFQHFTISE